jgi:hypothetical protein
MDYEPARTDRGSCRSIFRNTLSNWVLLESHSSRITNGVRADECLFLVGKRPCSGHNRKTDDFHPRLEIRLATTLRTQPIIMSTTASFDSC